MVKRNAYGVLMGKQEGKIWLSRPRHRYDGNIKMHIKEIGWKDMDWIDLAQDKKHCSEPPGSAVCWEFD
jgi:hypothetical protein